MTRKSIMERFLGKIDFSSADCWEWIGAKSVGYGSIRIDGKTCLAHRVSLQLHGKGTPPKGMHVDHICRNKACVNPSHLEVVSPRVNSLRGYAGIKTILAANRKTHCVNGHARTPENLWEHPKTGHVTCIICKNINFKRWYERRYAEYAKRRRLRDCAKVEV